MGIGKKGLLRASTPPEDPELRADLLVELAETTAEAILRRAEEDAARIRRAARAPAEKPWSEGQWGTDARDHSERLADLARRLQEQASASEQLTREVMTATDAGKTATEDAGKTATEDAGKTATDDAGSEFSATTNNARDRPAASEQPAEDHAQAAGVHPALRPKRR